MNKRERQMLARLSEIETAICLLHKATERPQPGIDYHNDNRQTAAFAGKAVNEIRELIGTPDADEQKETATDGDEDISLSNGSGRDDHSEGVSRKRPLNGRKRGRQRQ